MNEHDPFLRDENLSRSVPLPRARRAGAGHGPRHAKPFAGNRAVRQGSAIPTAAGARRGQEHPGQRHEGRQDHGQPICAADAEPEQRVVSTSVDEVIRAIVELGGTYPDVVQALQQAKADGALVEPLRSRCLAATWPRVRPRGRTMPRRTASDAPAVGADSQRAPLEVATPLPELVRPTAVKIGLSGVESQESKSRCSILTLDSSTLQLSLPCSKPSNSPASRALPIARGSSFRAASPSSSGPTARASPTSSTPSNGCSARRAPRACAARR